MSGLRELVEWYSDILYAFLNDVEENYGEGMREGIVLARHAVEQLKKFALRAVEG